MASFAFDLTLTLGVVEIGVLLSSLLYGMSLVQTYIYATNCKSDSIWLKTVVSVVWFVDSLANNPYFTDMNRNSVFETLHTASLLLWT